MSATDFKDLERHVGHQIECVYYGQEGQQNVAIECELCNEILLDFDRSVESESFNVTPFDREHIKEIMHDKPGFDWFTCKMLRILPTCDVGNREAIRSIYPDIVALFEDWKNGKT